MPNPTHLIALDPGIDDTGVAIFNLNKLTPANAGLAVERLDLLTSNPKESIETRCIAILQQLSEILDHYPAAQVAIEAPSYTGKYHGHSAKGRSFAAVADGIAKLNRLIGTLVATVTLKDHPLEIIEPDGLPRMLQSLYKDVKSYRRASVQEIFRRADRGKGNVPGWGARTTLSNQDKIDAVWIGLRVLLSTIPIHR